jgi:hypothetical protein
VSKHTSGALKQVTERIFKLTSNLKRKSKIFEFDFSSTKKQKIVKTISERKESTCADMHSRNIHLGTQSH